MTLLLESALKVSVVLLAALAAAACFRRQSAALRHWIVTTAVLSSLCVPTLAVVLPRWHIEMNAPRVLSRFAVSSPSAPQAPPDAAAATPTNAPEPGGAPPIDLARAAFGLWAAGAALGMLFLGVGLGRLALLARQARPMRDERWASIAGEIGARLDLRQQVLLLQSASSATLMTWGAVSPKVMLPGDAHTWSPPRIRIVLAHELAHISRGDWFVQIAAECLRIAYWFNPLVWVAARRLRRESEQACDDAVLAMGIERTQYAAELVDFARQAGKSDSWLPAPAMAQPSSLERRVTAMLNTTLNRVPPRNATRWLLAAAGLVAAVALTAVTVGGQTFSSLSGAIYDATNRVLPKVTLRLTNAQSGAEYKIESDESGRYTFVGLPQGDYTLQADRPGFSRLTGSVRIAGQDETQDVRLEVGSLEETLTIVDGQPQTPPRPAAGLPAFLLKPCEPKNVGGSIRPPAKLGDARPIYPAAYRNSAHTETVVLQTVIDREGMIREANPVGSPTPDFANASVEAVRQWRFSSTLLNCEPTEVKMTVTLHFNSSTRPR